MRLPFAVSGRKRRETDVVDEDGEQQGMIKWKAQQYDVAPVVCSGRRWKVGL